ncbi:hypothetical protein [Micromonospora sp. NPDC005174]|uniref:DUF7167 family protein n=1 Tax=Micromonospora sp. NPDC005174 TaxID=3157018 RepID=UPI0033A0D8B5
MTERTDPVVIELNCEANPSTDTVEIDRAEWDAMTPSDRAVMLNDMVDEHISTSGGGGWYIADTDDEASVGTTPTKVALPLADNAAVLDAVEKWLIGRGLGYEARDLLARIDAAITGKEA